MVENVAISVGLSGCKFINNLKLDKVTCPTQMPEKIFTFKIIIKMITHSANQLEISGNAKRNITHYYGSHHPNRKPRNPIGFTQPKSLPCKTPKWRTVLEMGI